VNLGSLMLTSVERLLFVRGVPIFQQLRDDFLVQLAAVMEELIFVQGEEILIEGEEERSLYILVTGRVELHSCGQELGQLEAGATFGEMALFEAQVRSAGVIALVDCTCLVLTQSQFYDAIEANPSAAISMIRLLARRIRQLSEPVRRNSRLNYTVF